MNNKKYIKEVLVTESREDRNTGVLKRLNRLKPNNISRLLHGAMGITTEAGELMDMLKKHIYYGKELDLVNIEEEIGDLFWYISIIIDEIGSSFTKIQKKNIEKLRARYGKKFTEKRALNRNLLRERKILEK